MTLTFLEAILLIYIIWLLLQICSKPHCFKNHTVAVWDYEDSSITALLCDSLSKVGIYPRSDDATKHKNELLWRGLKVWLQATESTHGYWSYFSDPADQRRFR